MRHTDQNPRGSGNNRLYDTPARDDLDEVEEVFDRKFRKALSEYEDIDDRLDGDSKEGYV